MIIESLDENGKMFKEVYFIINPKLAWSGSDIKCNEDISNKLLG